MSKPVLMDGGGVRAEINIDVDEITLIYQQIESILNEFEGTIIPSIEKLKTNDFYSSGKAKKAMDAFPEANEKITEIYNHYARASLLVIDTLTSMMEADRTIALEIIEKLEL